ncbi:enoyl-CoA hydratase/isomerase family protein [Halomarina halobia]|uniref:Enoyl-CoA hydratase/isomerase family protein n=1 Tax=Halomarina halobia TaxID=3033386 RepID=A0ABD6AF83_9EURY|nr:enoyl-CoA hydratase-related protein [Halomarina sp. PSR21]
MHEELDAAIAAFDEETGVGSITLNRPDALNALNGQLRADIEAAFERFREVDDEADGAAVRVVVIEGAGDRAFCAGADVNEFSGDGPATNASRPVQEIVEDCPAPVVAKIDGYCLGGGFELALACDLRYASESSRLGLPEVDLGIIPGAGGVQYVARLAGPAVARELAMTGEHVPAAEAADLGLVNDAFADDDFEAEVAAVVETLAAKPPLSLRAIKESALLSTQVGLAEGRRYDRARFPRLLATEDHAEGARAFREDDYEPEFVGR